MLHPLFSANLRQLLEARPAPYALDESCEKRFTTTLQWYFSRCICRLPLMSRPGILKSLGYVLLILGFVM